MKLEAHLRYQQKGTTKVSKLEQRAKKITQVSTTLWIKVEGKKVVTKKNTVTLTPDTFQRPISQRSQKITIQKQYIFRIAMQQKSQRIITPRPDSYQSLAVQQISQRAPNILQSERAMQPRSQMEV